MHRLSSHSSSRSSDEFLVNLSPSALKGFNSNEDSCDNDAAAVCDDASKKNVFVKPSFAEKSVHLIPLVLLFCLLVLWWFSNPVDLKLHWSILSSYQIFAIDYQFFLCWLMFFFLNKWWWLMTERFLYYILVFFFFLFNPKFLLEWQWFRYATRTESTWNMDDIDNMHKWVWLLSVEFISTCNCVII